MSLHLLNPGLELLFTERHLLYPRIGQRGEFSVFNLTIEKQTSTQRARDTPALGELDVPPLEQTPCVEGMPTWRRIVDRLLFVVADCAHLARLLFSYRVLKNSGLC